MAGNKNGDEYMLRWVGWGYLALALSMSILLFLPVQTIVAAMSSLSAGSIGFAYLILLVLGGIFLIGLLAVASLVLRAIGWFWLCRSLRGAYCAVLASVVVVQPIAIVSMIIGTLTLNANASISISVAWLALLAELLGVAKLYSDTRYLTAILLAIVGYSGAGLAAVASSTSKNLVTSLLGHLAASAIAVLVLGIIATILILHPNSSPGGLKTESIVTEEVKRSGA